MTKSSPEITECAEDRYSRQVLFSGIGRLGQDLLARARVAIVGVGGTGATAATLLSRAGIGHLTLVDRDVVDCSNLQRQILFDEADAASSTPKATAARSKILSFSSAVDVNAVVADVAPANIEAVLGACDLILDCTDNFETRYLINDYAVQKSKPWIYAAAVGSVAATMNVIPGTSSCLACLFPARPAGPFETCETAGVLGSAVSLAASLQTAEALKIVTQQNHLLRTTLFSYDVWTNIRSEVSSAAPDPGCMVCGQRVFSHLGGSARSAITLCGRNSVQIHEHQGRISLPDLYYKLQNHADLTALVLNELAVRFRRGPHQVTVFADGRALIQGTTDTGLARSLYARFIGS